MSSDSVIHTYTKWKRLRNITQLIPEQENESFRRIASTIGSMMVSPGNRIDRRPTINGARGLNPQICDRFDLTLECIRRHYFGQSYNPLGETLSDYGKFFSLFENFQGYVDFFLLHDLVIEDCSAVKFVMPFDDFSTPPVPKDLAAYEDYRRLSIEFIEARNRRIDRFCARVSCP